MRKKRKTNRGISIAIVLMVIMIIIVIGLAVATVGIQHLSFVSKDRFHTESYYAAQAGISRSMIKIRQNESWNGYEDPPSNRNATFYDVAMPNNANVTFSVRVYNNIGRSSAMNAENGIVVPINCCYILSEGRVGPRRYEKSIKQVGAMIRKASIFDFALFAKKSLTFRSGFVDAYDHRLGAYGVPAAMQSGEGNVGTNSNGARTVTISGTSSTIDGYVYVGPDGNPESVINWSGASPPFDGVGVLPQEQPMPSVTPPATLGAASPVPISGVAGGSTYNLNPGSYEAISGRSRDTYVLCGSGSIGNPAPGIYMFRGIDLSGRAKIEIDNSRGPVVIYVDGNIDLGGATTCNVQYSSGSVAPAATDLRIYGTPNCLTVNMAGNPQAYYCIYAPEADVTVLGNAEVFGAIVGNNITFAGNAPMHYDTALKNIYDIYVLKIDTIQRF